MSAGGRVLKFPMSVSADMWMGPYGVGEGLMDILIYMCVNGSLFSLRCYPRLLILLAQIDI